MPRLSNIERQRSIRILEAGLSCSEVARRMNNCHHTTIIRVRQRPAQTGSVTHRPRRGRPRVTTSAQDRRIRVRPTAFAGPKTVVTASRENIMMIEQKSFLNLKCKLTYLRVKV